SAHHRRHRHRRVRDRAGHAGLAEKEGTDICAPDTVSQQSNLPPNMRAMPSVTAIGYGAARAARAVSLILLLLPEQEEGLGDHLIGAAVFAGEDLLADECFDVRVEEYVERRTHGAGW